MDRRSSWAILLAVLFACVHTAGCNSGTATTAPLAVTTTALPNGLQNTPYSATLQGTGGTSPYTWSQTAGGAMPPGVTLSSAGIFSGTPTKSGTFGPYTFKVTDADSAVATSPGISIKIASSSLSVSTTSLPNGAVGIAYSTTLSATGGASPYSWSQTSGGAMPPGIATITGAGVIAGTPTSAGTYGPYVFTVIDTKNTAASSVAMMVTVTGSATAVCKPLGNEAALTAATPYAFLLKGTDANGNPIDIAGSFTPDGTGGISAAAADYNGFTNGPEPLAVNLASSSYAFGTSSTEGCLYLAFSGLASADVRKAPSTRPSHLQLAASTPTRKIRKPAITAVPIASVLFAFYLSGFDGTIYHTGRIIESDNTNGKGTNASGFVQVQTPAAFALTSLQANYAFGVDGWTATPSVIRTAMAGTFTNSSGTLSAGYADLNAGGTPSGEMTGGYGVLNSTIDTTTGRGTGSYFTTTPRGNLTFDFAFYILNASDLILLSTDLAEDDSTTPLLAGRALASNATFSTGSLAGYYLLASQGFQSVGTNTGNLAELGTLNADSNGNIPTATIYSNDAGTYTTNQYPGGTYSVEAASGRVSISGLTASSPIVYLTAGTGTDDAIAGFSVGTDAQASSGVVVIQTATTPAYTVGSVTGNYAASTEEDVDGSNGAFLGEFSFNGTGGYILTPKTTGTVPSIPSTGSIAVNTDGSGNLDGGKFPLVTNGTVVFAIPDSGDPLLFVLVSGTTP